MPARPEFLRRQSTAEITNHRRTQHDQRERHIERKNRGKRRRRNRPQPIVLQRPRTDAMRRLHDNGRHRRLDPVKQPGDHRHFTEGDIEPRQENQDEQRRQHEQRPGHNPAPAPMHQPANVSRQLLRLRPRQQHAIVQGMQKTPLGNPAPPLDQLLVHDRNLPGRPAETDKAQLQPEPERLAQTHGLRPNVVITRQRLNFTHRAVPFMQSAGCTRKAQRTKRQKRKSPRNQQ
jgi:hypothetical protein